jgi:hypothetical protein
LFLGIRERSSQNWVTGSPERKTLPVYIYSLWAYISMLWVLAWWMWPTKHCYFWKYSSHFKKFIVRRWWLEDVQKFLDFLPLQVNCIHHLKEYLRTSYKSIINFQPKLSAIMWVWTVYTGERKSVNVRFEVLTLVIIKSAVISDVRMYSLVNAIDISGEHTILSLGSKSKPQKQSWWRTLLHKVNEGVSDKN